MNTNGSGALAILGVPLIVILLIWLGTAFVAATVAPADRRQTFFVLTLLLFGPLGIALALIANPRTAPLRYVQLAPRPLAPGRVRQYCPRCGAENDVPVTESGYECWRCSERGIIAADHAIDTRSGPTAAAKQPIDTQSGPTVAADKAQSLGDIWNHHLTGESPSHTWDDLKQWWKDRNR
jgi:hypothetical protein